MIQHGWSKGASENGPYRPCQPENSAYYQCVEDHFEDLEQVYEERFERAYGFYRPYLRSVIYRYLECGILRNGFARVLAEHVGNAVVFFASNLTPTTGATFPVDGGIPAAFPR